MGPMTTIKIPVEDGTTLPAYLARPATDPAPVGVIVAHGPATAPGRPEEVAAAAAEVLRLGEPYPQARALVSAAEAALAGGNLGAGVSACRCRRNAQKDGEVFLAGVLARRPVAA